MNLSTDNNKPNSASRIVLFNLGFRIFFLSAGVFSILSISIWSAITVFKFALPVNSITPGQWHAHELIFGYAMAVMAGFLLTATKNWTGLKTLHGWPLMILFAFWAGARILLLCGSPYTGWAGLFDMAFVSMLLIALGQPIIKAKQWKQLAIISKVMLLGIFNLLFYLGAAGVITQGINWGVYGGLFLVISLILTLGRRVVPFFIEKGVTEKVTLHNSKWLDRSNLIFFLGFTLVEVFMSHAALSASLALVLFAINARRLIGWHTPGIWAKSLLWSLYLAFWFITLGFALFAAAYFAGINKYLAIHAFAYGGIGVMTLAMMSRVALGHSGRSIENPPRILTLAFILLLTGALVRVLMPLIVPPYYITWIGLSQLAWLVSFLIFCLVYLPILAQPRVDGRPG